MNDYILEFKETPDNRHSDYKKDMERFMEWRKEEEDRMIKYNHPYVKTWTTVYHVTVLA